MLRQFIAAEFKHGSTDDYYPDQVKKLTDLVNDWIKNGDYTSIPKSIKEYFGTWVGEGLIRNSDYNAWKRLLNNSAAHKLGQTNRQRDNAVTLRNRLWILCKHVKRAAERRQHKINPETIDGYSQIMKSLEIFDKVHEELWPDYDLIPPPKLDGEEYDHSLNQSSVQGKIAAFEERLTSQNNGKRRPSHSRKSSGESKTVSTKPDKLYKLKKQIRTFAREFNELLNHPLAPAESKFISAEPQIQNGELGSFSNPFDNVEKALKDCKKQIEDEGSTALNGDEAVINFGFVYVGRQKYWIIYINNFAGYLQNLPHGLNSRYNILTYAQINESCHPFGPAGTTAGNSQEARTGRTIWEELKSNGLVENPSNEEIFGPSFDDEPTIPVRKPRSKKRVRKPRSRTPERATQTKKRKQLKKERELRRKEEYKKLKKKYREFLIELLKMIETDMLPKDWTQHKDDSGETYYFNSATKESQWKHPQINNLKK